METDSGAYSCIVLLLWKKYDDSKDDSNGKPDTEEQIDEAEEDIAEKGADSQTEKDRINESVGEQEEQEGDEISAIILFSFNL